MYVYNNIDEYAKSWYDKSIVFIEFIQKPTEARFLILNSNAKRISWF